MTRLSDLDLQAHLTDPARKQQFVTPMFDLVAPRYDAFTRAFSLGMDARWKRLAIAEMQAITPSGARVLDLACGTGDLAYSAQAVMPGAQVAGLDASARMIQLARSRGGSAAGIPSSAQRVSPPQPSFAVGDMMHLDVADQSIDAVVAGYGFRNVPDHRKALSEAERVLRPGGALVTLDFYRPEAWLWRTLFLSYLRAAGNLFGWAWHGQAVAYGYIAPSIDHFVSAARFSDDIRAAGFEVLRVHRFLLGGVAVHVARRSPAR